MNDSFELDVLYRDAALLVVNKPSGLSVHRGWDAGDVFALTLARAIAGCHVYPAHRLDRSTSGVLVFGLSAEVARALGESFQTGGVHKRYLALVRGITPERGHIDHAIAKERGKPKMAAQTDYARLGTFERYSLVEAFPKTGRLHQIRRHMKHISHPIIGDVRYGKADHNRRFRADFNLHRMALHASDLSLPHPTGGARLSLHAPVPPDLAVPLAAMGFDAGVFGASSC